MKQTELSGCHKFLDEMGNFFTLSFIGIQLNGTSRAFVADRLNLSCFTNLILSSLELWREEQLVARTKNSSILYIIDPVSVDEQDVTYICRGYISHDSFEESNLTLSVEGEDSSFAIEDVIIYPMYNRFVLKNH